MRRRSLILGLAGARMAWPVAAPAQQKRTQVIGFLSTTVPEAHETWRRAFVRGLSDTGYVEGRNLLIEYRQADGRYDQLAALATDLVARKVDLIVTGGTPAAPAAKGATSTIPIVSAIGDDPISLGLVPSLARPGGNLTGISFGMELVPKRLELLSDLVPGVKEIGLLVNPTRSSSEQLIRAVKDAALTRGLEVHVLKAVNADDVDVAFDLLADLHGGALVVPGDPFFSTRREQFVSLASRHRVPAIYAEREFVNAGGLISYGTNLTMVFYQLGIYAGRVLNGEKPADLPIEQPTKFELVINLRTAKALGLTVPQSILARADEVIE